MGLSRRNVLIGLGGIVAGGGALVGTGAFTTVQAERTVNVSTAGDASAFLALQPSGEPNDDYVEGGGNNDTITITLNGSAGQSAAQGLNQNAITTIRQIVTVTNNGTQNVDSLTLEMTGQPQGGSISLDDTFSFTVTSSSGNTQKKVGNGEDILGSNGLSTALTPGAGVDFGIEIDLDTGGTSSGDLPNGDYDLTITANTP